MATHVVDLQPWWPDFERLPTRSRLYYDSTVDSLLISFDPTRPAEHVYLDTGLISYVALRAALDTAEVVGIEIDALQPLALRQHPSWQRLVHMAGVDEFKAAEPADYPVIAAFIAEIAAFPLA
ncbi:MAG TPA: DUF2283 domain-containing protein [Thermomicrobiales bacterium]|nr:DUF2283 domain-containing protein [Thermomicrobiales bacterium]